MSIGGPQCWTIIAVVYELIVTVAVGDDSTWEMGDGGEVTLS